MPLLIRLTKTTSYSVRLSAMAKAVTRDAHKMHAFVRFRQVQTEEGVEHFAWFEPEHHIVRREAGFFIRRFSNMAWSILTPELSIHWDRETLREGPGATKEEVVTVTDARTPSGAIPGPSAAIHVDSAAGTLRP